MHDRFRSLVCLLAVALFAAGCAAPEEPAEEPTPEPEPAMEPAGLDRAVLDDPTRPEDERAQDASRMAVDVYEFLGVEPGMTVADVWTGGGYNTHLLSRLNAEGKVYAVLGFYTESEDAEGLRTRVAEAALENVEIVSAITDVPADSVDVAIAVRNFHDADEYGDGRTETVAQLFSIIKPGGVVGIVEVATPHEGWHEETHRLNEQAVIDDFTSGGFELADSSDMLANPDDDHTTTGFEEGRHTTDRYLLKFVKPETTDATTN